MPDSIYIYKKIRSFIYEKKPKIEFTHSQYLYLYFTICSVDTFSFEIRYVLRRIRGHQNGAPEEIRTPDPRFRKPLLYPTELQAHWSG